MSRYWGQLSSSSACGPTPITRPASSTTIRSASVSADGRVGRDQAAGGPGAAASPSSTPFAASGSSALVTSSSSRIGTFDQQRPGERDALALAAGELAALLADLRLVAGGQPARRSRARAPAGPPPRLGPRGVRPPVGDVLGDRHREQRVLSRGRRQPPQQGQVALGQRAAVELRIPLVGCREAVHELEHGGHAGAGRAHERHRLSAPHVEADPAERARRRAPPTRRAAPRR